jgi:hypothetical protein
MTDFKVTTTWLDDNGRETTTRQYVSMTNPNPDDDAAQDYFDALQAASTASLKKYSVMKFTSIVSPTAAGASPYSVSDRAVLAFKATEGDETVRIPIRVPKNAVFNDDEQVKVDHAAIAPLIAYLELNGRTISGKNIKFTGGWRAR